MYTLEYSRKKAAELREKNRAPLPVLAEIAKMPLLLAQQYLTGEKVMNEKTYRKLYNAVAVANNQVSPPISIDWDKVDVPEDGLERFVYLSGNENNKALIVRFSGEEWKEIKRLFPEDADIEGAVRAFIIKMLDTDEKRQLYCPKKREAVWTHAGLPKEKTAFYEDGAVRVAVDYAAFVRNRLEQVLSWAAVVPEEFSGGWWSSPYLVRSLTSWRIWMMMKETGVYLSGCGEREPWRLNTRLIFCVPNCAE